MGDEPPRSDVGYGAKIRYRQADATCRLARVEADELVVEFDQPQWAVTPGQSVVLYHGEVCLGGGVIQ
jgi:tRNA-specific 2-thiouridylase